MNDNDIPVLRLSTDGKIHDHDGPLPEGAEALEMSIEARGTEDALQVRVVLTAPDGVPAPKMTAVFTMDAPDFGDDPKLDDDSDTHRAALYARAQIAALSAVLPEVLGEAFKEATSQAVKEQERKGYRAEVVAEVIANLAMLKAGGDKAAAKAFVLDTLTEWSETEAENTPSAAQRDHMAAKVYDQIDALPSE